MPQTHTLLTSSARLHSLGLSVLVCKWGSELPQGCGASVKSKDWALSSLEDSEGLSGRLPGTSQTSNRVVLTKPFFRADPVGRLLWISFL